MHAIAITSNHQTETASQNLLQVIGGALFIALTAQIKIPLFFTPVPLVLYSLTILLVGGMLGKKKGTLSVLLFLTMAACGLPVLGGWRSEPGIFFGPLGGYFIGFFIQSYLIGWLMEKTQAKSITYICASTIGTTVLQLSIGACWLGAFIGWEQGWLLGFLPFLISDTLKALIGAAVLKTTHAN